MLTLIVAAAGDLAFRLSNTVHTATHFILQVLQKVLYVSSFD